jgi:DNA-binding NarL/FixJ family response regulator
MYATALRAALRAAVAAILGGTMPCGRPEVTPPPLRQKSWRAPRRFAGLTYVGMMFDASGRRAFALPMGTALEVRAPIDLAQSSIRSASMVPPLRYERPSHAPPRTILWLLASALDCDALGLWCLARVGCQAFESYADLDVGIARCEAFRPRLLVLDPCLADGAIQRGVTALVRHWASYLLVLDRLPREARVIEILDQPAASYLGRTAGPDALAKAIHGILDRGDRVIDPALASRVRLTENGYKLTRASLKGSVAALTAREREVMRLLAHGNSVDQCAASLGLARSTIDNHKARLMKKLGVHRASELTCRAVREGVIAL